MGWQDANTWPHAPHLSHFQHLLFPLHPPCPIMWAPPMMWALMQHTHLLTFLALKCLKWWVSVLTPYLLSQFPLPSIPSNHLNLNPSRSYWGKTIDYSWQLSWWRGRPKKRRQTTLPSTPIAPSLLYFHCPQLLTGLNLILSYLISLATYFFTWLMATYLITDWWALITPYTAS